MAKILVPLDGSHRAEKALPFAMSLGAELPAEVVLFRAILPPSGRHRTSDQKEVESDPWRERRETRARKDLHSVARRLLADGATGVGCAVRYGSPADAIVEYARQAEVQLIIMASRGACRTGRWPKGSVTEKVLRKATVPVLLTCALAPESSGARLRPHARILAPLDGSGRSEQVLAPAAALAQWLGGELILCHASCPYLFESSTEAAQRIAKSYLERLAAPLKKQGTAVSVAVKAGPVTDTIVKIAQRKNVDLIAMCPHRRRGVARWLLGSVAGQTLTTGSIPVLLMQDGGGISEDRSESQSRTYRPSPFSMPAVPSR